MVLPIRSSVGINSFPIATILIILLNIIVYVHSKYPVNVGYDLVRQYGFVPNMFFFGDKIIYGDLFRSISYMFVHVEFFHLLSNIYFLYIFGSVVECGLGRIRYMFLYLLLGVFAAFTHSFATNYPSIPVIGASGAIAGVLGMYLSIYPVSRIKSVVFIIVIPIIFNVYAFVYLFFWIAAQIFFGLYSNTPGIAWWAHIGGFVFGLFAGLYCAGKKG